jgi:hypothetical protein
MGFTDWRRCWFGIGACALLSSATAAGYVVLNHYTCVFQQPCGPVSPVCWAPQHPWGSWYCTFCNGQQVQDLCQRSLGGSCNYLEENQSCGSRLAGTCVPSKSQPEIGWRTPPQGPPEPIAPCTVPRC